MGFEKNYAVHCTDYSNHPDYFVSMLVVSTT